MNEEFFFIGLIILALFGLPLTALVMAIVSLVRSGRIKRLAQRIAELEAIVGGLAEPRPVVQTPPEEPRAKEEPVEALLVEGPAMAEAPIPAAAAATAPSASEAPPEPIQWEMLVGRRALGWVAVVSLIFGMAFFLRYAIQNDWIGPLGRVAVGAVVGAALVFGGWNYHRRGWRVFSQMLTGAGVIVLYLATYSAFGFYHLLPRPMAAMFLAIVVVESAILALRCDSLGVALTAVLGGLATPLLMHSDHDQYVALFTYLAVLDSAVVLLVLARPWPAVGTVALLGTQGLFWSWYSGNYHPEKLSWALGFQAVVFLLFLADALGTYVLKRRRAGPEHSARLILGAAFWFLAVYALFNEDYGPWMGSAAVAMAVVYALLARLMLACRPDQSGPLLATLAVSVGFVALAFPIQADAQWVALGWMAQAAVLWWFGLRVQAPTLRGLAAGLASLALVRLLAFDMPYEAREPFLPIVNEFALPAIGVAACLLAGVAASRRFKRQIRLDERVLVAMAGLGGVLLLWLVLSVDCYGYFDAQASARDDAHWRWLGQMSLSILWAVFATVVLACGFRLRLAPLRWTALGLYVVTVVKVFLVDMAELDQIYRIVAFFVLAIFLGVAAWAYQRIRIELNAAADV